MEIEKEGNALLPPVDNGTPAPRKAWETPHFDRQDVRSITEAKSFNAVEAGTLAGPAS